MRPKRKAMTNPLARTLGAGALLGALAGCQMLETRPYAETAQAPALPATAIGALVLGAEGELFIVDGAGRRVQGCVMPGTTDAAAPECAALTGTTLMAIESVAMIRHTGSTCTTVGPIIQAGRAFYFQLPPGCTH